MKNLIILLPEPAVSRVSLMVSSGTFWFIGAGVLFYRGFNMLANAGDMLAILIGVGVLIGALKYYFMLSKTVKRNVERIHELAPHKDKICIFAFQSLLSYLLVMLMMGLGFLMRTFFDYPKTIGTIFIAIGVALILGGIQYISQARRIETS